MCIIAISNQKGGVGKTTSTFNIATALAIRGERVLMVDLDAQASLTLSAGYNPLNFETNIVSIFENSDTITDAIYETDIENLSIIPSTTLLASTELALINARARERKLEKALQKIEGVFDYILLDCPPQLSLITVNALTTANYVLIPVETSQLSYLALESLLETIEGIKEDLNGKLEMLGVLPTLYDSRTLVDNMILDLLTEDYEILGVIKRTVKAKKGLNKGVPVILSEPNSEISLEYKNVAEKIIKKLGV